MEEPLPREQFLQQLQVYSQKFPAEISTWQRFIEFVAHNPDCFSRDLQIGHITGSAWVVNATGDRVVLTLHRKLNKWIQLGGHCDGESNVLQVALREAIEESGVEKIQVISPEIFDLDVHLVPLYKNIPAHFHFDTRFAFRMAENQPLQISDESHDLAWVDIKKIHAYNTDESTVRMARKWLAGEF